MSCDLVLPVAYQLIVFILVNGPLLKEEDPLHLYSNTIISDIKTTI